MARRSLCPGEHVIEVTVRGKPIKAGVAPYSKLIDRVSDDNLVSVEGLQKIAKKGGATVPPFFSYTVWQ